MSEQDGLICAYVLDGRGGARALQWPDIARIPLEGFTWVHLHLDGENARRWLVEKSGLPEIVIDALEDKALTEAQAELRAELWEIRRVAIELRRYIGPQRDAMTRLTTERVPWIDAQAGQRLREVADRITRYVEDLDAARERAVIIQDELTTWLAETMNRNMYVLSVIAAIFLPLSLLTGLLGINVGGIPGVEWEWAFWLVTAGIVVIGILGYMLLRRLRWV